MSAAAAPALPRTSLVALAGPLLIIMILGMMILPLPPLLLDLLFTFNIALGMIVLLTSLYTLRPLDFAVFPSVLLITTLLRLSLNVASTRVVLLNGHAGPDAAGKVIKLGHAGDKPVAGDWTGDGVDKVGVYEDGATATQTAAKGAGDATTTVK